MWQTVKGQKEVRSGSVLEEDIMKTIKNLSMWKGPALLSYSGHLVEMNPVQVMERSVRNSSNT